MKLRGWLFLVATLAAVLFRSDGRSAEPVGDAVEGARIAAELRTLHPQSGTNWTGVLKRRVAGRRVAEVPVTCFIFVETNRWLSVYQTSATTNGQAEKLVVTRYFDGRTEYHHGRAAAAADVVPASLDAAAANVAFAGSDFWLSDLGTQFLQWPVQLLLPGEMRRGQPCYVLESVNPEPARGYARVRSWIEKENLGLLIAEAYDANGRMIKEFSAGTLAKDAHGNYQLKDMEIRSVKEKSQTKLEFKIDR